TILVLGGTGKVGRQLAPLLKAADVPALIASRSAKSVAGVPGVKFDWDDKSTWEQLFAQYPIDTVHIVVKSTADQAVLNKVFVDFALDKGVRRIVLLSGSPVEEGGPTMGKTHQYLHELGDQGKVEWAVLRPSWFFESFTEHRGLSVKEQGKLYSATGSGRIPFVSTENIAAVALHALTSPEPPNKEFLILGPELLTYSDVADLFTSVLGKKVEYVELSEAELAETATSFGIEPAYVVLLCAMETGVKNGAEDRTNDLIKTVTGKEPRRFRDFIEENKSVW
ncbi:hypothetical protein M426DRAFT_36942, partial [Hypoxylon sp. CI-4A]